MISLQSYLVCRHGAAGMNFEHSCTNGSVNNSMACEIYNGSTLQPENAFNGNNVSSLNFAANLEYGSSNRAIPARLQKLNWDISLNIYDALHIAEMRLVDRIQRQELETLDLRDYGKVFKTSTGFSPNAFFQMVLQAAYYSVYAQIRNGLELVLMRQYLHGGADVVRTTTPEVAAFARIFSDKKASIAEEVEAMRRTANKYVAISVEFAKGLRYHRHLHVLHQIWKRRRAFVEVAALRPVGFDSHSNESNIPTTKILTEPGWARLGTTILMGSDVEAPCLDYAGFIPAADDGFTFRYFIRQNHMAMNVCCRNGQTKRFIDGIEKTFQEIRAMLENTPSNI